METVALAYWHTRSLVTTHTMCYIKPWVGLAGLGTTRNRGGGSGGGGGGGGIFKSTFKGVTCVPEHVSD